MALWTPDQLTTLKMWLRGDDAGSTDGASVSVWTDASGNSNDATAVNAPTLDKTTGLNGHATVRFDGIAGSTATPYFTLLDYSTFTAGTICFVIKKDNDPAISSADDGGIGKFGTDTTNNVRNVYPFTDGKIYDDFGSTARKTVGNPTPSLASYHIGAFVSAVGLWACYINGLVFYATGSNTVSFNASPLLGISLINASDCGSFSGNMAEIALFNDGIPDTDRQKVEGYLAYKYGLQSVLPDNHPYKVSAPQTTSSGGGLLINAGVAGGMIG